MIHSRLWWAKQQLLKHSKLPILVGPFRGEVGFEALYWIPFVRRMAKRLNIDPARLIPITRGGISALYGMEPGPDLYTLATPQDVRVENKIQHAKHQQLKQTHWIEFDREVIQKAAEALCLKDYQTLHPGWMFAVLGPYFLSSMGLQELEQEALFDTLTVPALPAGLILPEKFVAVRFYLRYTFQAQMVAFAQESIKQIANNVPVVLLNSGLHVDDHIDINGKPHPNVVKLADLTPLTPENNLAVQSAVLGRALGFVGTYGGLAQLALRLGKSSVSYYQEWGGTAIAHKHLADAIALKHSLPCIVQKVGEIPLLQSIMPAVTVTPPSASSGNPLLDVGVGAHSTRSSL